MGHVPAGPVRFFRKSGDLQGRQRRGASGEGALAIPGSEGAQRRRALGVSGEDRAEAWYRAHGYEVLDRNWRCGDGELDLVLRLGRTVVFCEVKSRSGTVFGVPAEAVGPSKQARIRRLAARWLREHREGLKAGPAIVRFDVAALLEDDLEILEAAF